MVTMKSPDRGTAVCLGRGMFRFVKEPIRLCVRLFSSAWSVWGSIPRNGWILGGAYLVPTRRRLQSWLDFPSARDYIGL